MEPAGIVATLEPIVSVLLDNMSAFPLHLSVLLIAVDATVRDDLLPTFLPVLADEETAISPHALAVLRRFAMLAASGAESVRSGRSSIWGQAVARAARALDHVSFRRTIDHLALLAPAAEDRPVHDLGTLAKIARMEGWDAAYRRAQDLLVPHVPDGAAEQAAVETWLGLGLPGAVVAMAGRRARASISPDQSDRRTRFDTVGDGHSALAIWNAAAVAGETAHVLHHAAIDPVEVESARLSYASRDADPTGVPIWLFMTWREHAARLLSNLATLRSPAGKTVISIGGDGRPRDAAQATAAMLIPGIFFLNRAPISWGGPKLLFETALDVMRAFAAQAPSDAWFQVVCDRSRPMIGLNEFGARATSSANLRKYRFPGELRAWHGEIGDHQLPDLPDRLEHALEDVFGAADAENLLALSGPWSEIPDDDYRLRMFTFNFTDDIHFTTGNTRLGGIAYGISPHDADVKWMSFARLRAFVDVAGEKGLTIARSHPPYIRRWIFEVLGRLDVRNGDPFNFLSHRFIQAMFARDDFNELATAMGLGFGPEMNFFNSLAATMLMSDEVLHVYKRTETESVRDEHLDVLATSADLEGSVFFRKSDLAVGAAPIKHFADRLRDASAWREVHWVAASPQPRFPDRLPSLFDERLMDRLVGIPFELRDLLGRYRAEARLVADGRVEISGMPDGGWSFETGVLTIDFRHPWHGTKRYRALAANGQRLTLVPDEAVSEDTGWGRFLSFPLANLRAADAVLEIVAPACGTSQRWAGGADLEACMLSAMAVGSEALPVPCLVKSGAVRGYREDAQGWLAMAEIDGMPTLLRLRGMTRTGNEVALVATKADRTDIERWDAARPGHPCYALDATTAAGSWTIERIEGEQPVRLLPDGRMLAEDGTAIGMWEIAPEGLRLYGPEGLRVALAHQGRIHDGRWRLSGWGQSAIGKPVSFALSQAPS